jgi:hypothetical protein
MNLTAEEGALRHTSAQSYTVALGSILKRRHGFDQLQHDSNEHLKFCLV